MIVTIEPLNQKSKQTEYYLNEVSMTIYKKIYNLIHKISFTQDHPWQTNVALKHREPENSTPPAPVGRAILTNYRLVR